MKIEFKEILFKDIDIELKALDEFEEYYEYSLLKYGDTYMDYDNQCCTIKSIGTLEEIINKVSARALDFELDHIEECNEYQCTINTLKYLIDLCLIAEKHINNEDRYEKEWLENCKKRIFNLEMFE